MVPLETYMKMYELMFHIYGMEELNSRVCTKSRNQQEMLMTIFKIIQNSFNESFC